MVYWIQLNMSTYMLGVWVVDMTKTKIPPDLYMCMLTLEVEVETP